MASLVPVCSGVEWSGVVWWWWLVTVVAVWWFEAMAVREVLGNVGIC